jgi:membrane-associated phospholipid phosphatase
MCASIVLFFLILSFTNQARAQRVPSAISAAEAKRKLNPTYQPHRFKNHPNIQWRSHWRHVGPVEYVLAPATILTGSFFYLLAPDDKDSDWNRPILFDKFARDNLVSSSSFGRKQAATISDFMAYGSYIQPLLLDPWLVAAIGYQQPEVGWNMFVISAQSYGISMSLNSFAKRIFSRSRPYTGPCASNANYDANCQSPDRFKSFYSGHSAMTATSAGLICAHHLNLPLYGGSWLDPTVCGLAIGLTATTGILRITSDNHWATDVIAGHLLGYLSGYLIPQIFYYKPNKQFEHFDPTKIKVTFMPQMTDDSLLLQAMGQF